MLCRCRSDRAGSTPSYSGGKVKRKQSPLAAVPPPPTHIPVTLEGAMVVTPRAGATPSDADDLKRSNRTRNRKVNYAALNAGITPDVDGELGSEGELDSPPITIHTRHEPRRTSVVSTQLFTPPAKINQAPVVTTEFDDHLGNSANYKFVEEAEIRRLKIKLKRRGLSEVEKRKFKQLKASLSQKVKAFRKKLDKLRKNNDQPGALTSKNFLVKKALSDASATFPTEVVASSPDPTA